MSFWYTQGMSDATGNYFKYTLESDSDEELLGHKFQQAYLKLSQSPLIFKGETSRAISWLCKEARQILRVDQLSFWRYDPDKNSISCDFIWPLSEDFNNTLDLSAYPKYGNAIKDKGVIVANNAQNFEITNQLAEDYLIPNNIQSMLDAPVVLDEELIGVICCEHRESLRFWTSEEILFVNLLANLIAFSEQSYKLHRANDYIISQFKELDEMHQVMSVENLDLSSKVRSLNAKLQHQNALLQEQNHRLREYARINSHTIRSPLSNLLGLIELARLEPEYSKNDEWRKFLEVATLKLDDQVHIMNQLLEDDEIIKDLFKNIT